MISAAPIGRGARWRSSTRRARISDGQPADLICVATGDPVNGITTWYKLTNRATGVTGYVSYVFLRDASWTNPVTC